MRRFARVPAEHRRDRARFGLPTDRPVILTGHQAGFWHPGILSKYIAADGVARAVGGVAAAVVVDHDTVDPLRIEAVIKEPAGRVRESAVVLHQRSGGGGLPRLRPPVDASELGRIALPAGLLESDRAALGLIRAALARFSDAESLGEQAALANAALLKRWSSAEPITARRLGRCLGSERLFSAATADPGGCVRAYNRAVADHPEAGIGPLFGLAREQRWELPFWLLDQDRGRRALFAEMVEQPGFDVARVATRALSLTASVRLGLCDLFIHGTGGAVYDRATDAWIGAWLGEELAPSVSISADVHRALSVECPRDVSAPEADHAVWLAHAAWHNPGLLGDEVGALRKRELLEQIDALAHGSADRLDRYRTMHAMLASVRAERASELAAIRGRARDMEAALEVQRLEGRRDWSSVLYPANQLDRLAATIGAMIAGADAP
jgi:hypothetical protein